jgi:hypothetical protein
MNSSYRNQYRWYRFIYHTHELLQWVVIAFGLQWFTITFGLSNDNSTTTSIIEWLLWYVGFYFIWRGVGAYRDELAKNAVSQFYAYAVFAHYELLGGILDPDYDNPDVMPQSVKKIMHNPYTDPHSKIKELYQFVDTTHKLITQHRQVAKAVNNGN